MKKKYRGCFLRRLGLFNKQFRQGSPVIWVHAVSVGEIKGAASLIQKLKSKHPLSTIIVSSITQTGHREAKRVLLEADYHVYLPLDFKPIVKRVIGKLKIDMVLVVETDLWPNFLKYCKKRGAQIVIVNGKLSERSFKRLLAAPIVSRWYYSLIDFFLVQDEVYRARFVDLMIPPEKIKVVPNLKLDDSFEELDEEAIEKKRSLYHVDGLSITIGSTHSGEEELILNQLIPLLDHYSHLKLFVVPRHPERFDEAEKVIKSYKIPYARTSNCTNYHKKRIILVDEMGQLRYFYQMSTLAIVGGSFVSKIGGHNVLEPLWYSTPCLFGPYMHNQEQFVSLTLHAKAGRQIKVSEVKNTVYELLNDDFKLKQMGRRGKDIFIKSSGGTTKTLEFLEKLLEKKKLKA